MNLLQLSQQYDHYGQLDDALWQKSTVNQVANFADQFSIRAKLTPNHIAVEEVATAKKITYEALDLLSDRIAEWALSFRVSRLAILLPNSIHFVAAVIGMAKASVTAVLLNIREPAEKLATLAKDCGVEDLLTNLDLISNGDLPDLKNMSKNDIKSVLADYPSTNKPLSVASPAQLDDPAVIIFTSGTTGRSKAALFSHRRLIGAGIAWSVRNHFNHETRCYIPLPLYHGNGLAVALASSFEAGGTAVLRERFSVTAFWQDIAQFDCDSCVYIGELWRYLLNNKAPSGYFSSPLKTIFGNGLSLSLWQQVIEQFNIRHVVEHYGATELPAGALINAFDVPGFCGFIPPSHPDAEDVMIVNANFEKQPIDESGQILIKVKSGIYKGYLNHQQNRAKTKSNLIENGDMWWLSGDELVKNADGFFTFIDRMDGSYRYKGENVSCQEVESVIYAYRRFAEVAVVGVNIEGISGKLGLASIVAESESADLADFLYYIKQHLASYAIPTLIRLVSEKHQTTATLKIQKNNIFDQFKDMGDNCAYFVLINNEYRPLNRKNFNQQMQLLGAKAPFLDGDQS